MNVSIYQDDKCVSLFEVNRTEGQPWVKHHVGEATVSIMPNGDMSVYLEARPTLVEIGINEYGMWAKWSDGVMQQTATETNMKFGEGSIIPYDKVQVGVKDDK